MASRTDTQAGTTGQDAQRNGSLRRLIALLKRSADIFTSVKAPSRGGAIAFYTITSIAPVLLIVIAIAGLVFGDEAARGAVFGQFQSLLGPQGAELLQNIIQTHQSPVRARSRP